MTIPFLPEDNDQIRARREHLEGLRALVGNVYPNKYERSQVTGGEDTVTAIIEKFGPLAPKRPEGEKPAAEEIERANAELNKTEVRISGRVATPPRLMGKAAFVHLSDGVSRLQIYVRKADVTGLRNDGEGPADGWQLFNLLDHGDFIGVAGFLFITKTGELSVHVREIQFLAKALLPMPDKMHGITDPEIGRRQRYADLISGSLKVEHEEGELTTRQVFERRSKVIKEMRRFLDDHGYIEVETPMLTPKATGAAAKPFKTHHNALDIDLYARIAPELYLKRLTVGGFERVYELNRNFRNEGIGYRWNPEFTMLEFYCAYMDVNGMMDFCEELLRTSVQAIIPSMKLPYGEIDLDLSRTFERLSMKQAIDKYWPSRWREITNFSITWLDDSESTLKALNFLLEIKGLNEPTEQAWLNVNNYRAGIVSAPTETEHAKNIEILFADVAESALAQPTFITDFPKQISPLSKASPSDPNIAERFELFVAGMEIANGFSELNDPEEQYRRFLDQMNQRERGDEEAMVMDEDYIRALSYGMPPAAGIGIGIDRFVMLLTNKHSIRDVILFPHMRPERKAVPEDAMDLEPS